MLFIFDENYPPSFTQGLKLLEEANKRSPIPVEVVHATEFMKKRGASDTDIIVAASDQNAIIITHDADFRRIKHYKPFLIKHKVGYVYFKTPKKAGGYHYWDIVKSFVIKWEEIKLHIHSDTHPFTYEVGKNGTISRCPF